MDGQIQANRRPAAPRPQSTAERTLDALVDRACAAVAPAQRAQARREPPADDADAFVERTVAYLVGHPEREALLTRIADAVVAAGAAPVGDVAETEDSTAAVPPTAEPDIPEGPAARPRRKKKP